METNKKIVLATTNVDKIKEIKSILKDARLITLQDLADNDEVLEDGNTFYENAFKKADYFFKKYKMPTIADDSGLCCIALNDAPGIYSARYSPSGKYMDNRRKLLDDLKNKNDRRAYFITVVCFIDEASSVHYFVGKLNGLITTEERGSNGFGYDSIFELLDCKKTLAEIDSNEKNLISHRYLAFKKLDEFLGKKLK